MKLSKVSRILLTLGSMALIIAYFVPMWQIVLWAPQYPEGLSMKIWTNALTGDIDIINGLNHYIGMKHISVEMFPEFQYINWLPGLLIAIGLAAALLGSGRILFSFTLLSYIYAILALWDFWQWGYEYGHNLSPNAAIKVEGMAYQPPLIGYKNLLNFTAYSGPDSGAWVLIAVCLMATIIWWWTFFKDKKASVLKAPKAGTPKLFALAVLVLAFTNCNSGPEPIRYGVDACTQCKMTITDKRFGAEVVTKKGRVFKFDDLNCLCAFLKDEQVPEVDINQIVVVDFSVTGTFVPVQQAFYFKDEKVKSPMRGDIASFSKHQDLLALEKAIGAGRRLQWDEVKAEF